MILYQEQVMQIASTIGGFTLAQADMLRRAMGKKEKVEMDRLKGEFLEVLKKKSFQLILPIKFSNFVINLLSMDLISHIVRLTLKFPTIPRF